MARTASQPRSDWHFDSLPQEAYLSLWRTYDRLRAIEDECFARYELTAQQYNVLRLLKALHPKAAPTLEIAERLVSRAPDITRMLDKLEQRGWIVRQRDGADRRSVLVGITPAGLDLVRRIGPDLRACHARQLGHMSAADLARIVKLLKAMRLPHESEKSHWR